ncbi:MAG: hypothetical protein KIS73_03775 [Enhydrobacter sp.]|nr:hypothetical protein [Enhydrobacter sp.]
METIGALVACGASLAIGVILGYRWTLASPWHLITGVMVGEILAGVYFAMSIWAGRHFPGLLDPRLVGLNFMALVVAAGFSGGLGAWFGYRKSMGRGLF